MENYLQRLIYEYRELDLRLKKIEMFLERNGSEGGIVEPQTELLKEQLTHMRRYFDVLGKRLDNLGFGRENAMSLHLPQISRRKVLERAVDECLVEMCMKSQPSDSYEVLCDEYELGKIKREDKVYDRYYLSREEYDYIKEKYKDAYNIRNTWRGNCDLIIRDLSEGGYADGSVEDENGLKTRTIEKIAPISDSIGEDALGKVIERIKQIRDFYRFDREENSFDFTLSLGSASPTFNKKVVMDYWRSQNKDIEIVERDPSKFWENDEYGEENCTDEECQDG